MKSAQSRAWAGQALCKLSSGSALLSQSCSRTAAGDDSEELPGRTVAAQGKQRSPCKTKQCCCTGQSRLPHTSATDCSAPQQQNYFPPIAQVWKPGSAHCLRPRGEGALCSGGRGLFLLGAKWGALEASSLESSRTSDPGHGHVLANCLQPLPDDLLSVRKKGCPVPEASCTPTPGLCQVPGGRTSDTGAPPASRLCDQWKTLLNADLGPVG